MFVDSHCHLAFPELRAKLPEIRAAMAEARVDRALCICTTLEEFDDVHSLATAHDNFWSSVGVHPDNEGVREPDVATLVELADGSLLHNMRSYHKKNRRAVATSKDGGRTWSPVKLDDALLEPVCQASILRCTWPENGERSRILFSNPASTKREKLTVRMSYDEGVTWPIGKLVFPGPAAYSCLVMLPDKSIGCLFECGKTNSYESITLARISQDWLEQKAAE